MENTLLEHVLLGLQSSCAHWPTKVEKMLENYHLQAVIIKRSDTFENIKTFYHVLSHLRVELF